ncbi:MAG TPA: glutamyl-tRNA reductase [Polyangia bacterium]|jgi:glutamyl-tRNA reductase|nr:glutamyl-tRNA reductase [Polyangia bacterium]
MAAKAPATIDVVVLGVSHRTAPVALRERLSVVPDQMDATLRELKTLPGVREVALLSTCNRVEIYAVASDTDAALRALGADLARRAGMLDAEIEPHLYARTERDAVKHLFRVASSLDSLVVGEPQILGQVKTTRDLAAKAETVGPVLSTCFERAFRVARRVRRDTEIARNPVSVSSVAVELAHNVFGDFNGKSVLVVGAGKMSDLAARALRSRGAALTVTNRTRARAEELAAAVQADVADFADLAGALGRADIVIASTGAQRPVLTRELLARVQRARRGRSLFLIDIAVPRDVEPSVTELEGVYVADIDDLQKEAAKHLAGRQGEAVQAESIVEEEVTRFLQTMGGRQLAPTVTAMRSHFIGLAHGEAERFLAGMEHLSERDRNAIVAFADAFAKKLLHLPQLALKKDAGEAVSLVAAVRALFDLQGAEPLPEGERGEALAETPGVAGREEPS